MNKVQALITSAALSAAVAVASVIYQRISKMEAVKIDGYTPEEWEKFKHWPGKETVQEEDLDPTTDDYDYEDIDEGENTVETTVEEKIVIGDGDGEIKKFSKEYRAVINKAYGEALDNESAVLELYGKTYGLGARGEAIEGGVIPGIRYNATDILKLRKKAVEADSK